MQPAPRSKDRTEAVRQLADELVRLRQRGLTKAYRHREPLSLPILEQLAAAAEVVPPTDATPRLRLYLDDQLAAWSDAKNEVEARFVRRLYQDEAGRWPGPGGPGGLLRVARVKEGIKDEDQFRRLQRLHLEAFASYLLNGWSEEASGEPGEDPLPASESAAGEVARKEPGAQPAKDRHMRRLVLAAVASLLALPVVIAGLVLTSQHGKQKDNHGVGGAGSSGSTTVPAQALFRFDNLGSTVPGGSTVFVYPGVGDSAADRKPDGQYTVGQEVPALCVTTGRRVASDPRYHETPKSSDLWVRVGDPAGPVQYATLTYGELEPADASRPSC